MYPVDRLNRIAESFPDRARQLWKQSKEAVAKMEAGGCVQCPVCRGHKRLTSYIRGFRPRPEDAFVCPVCNGEGTVKLPCPHDDLIGGWACCPVCYEGQHPNGQQPCDVCWYFIAEEMVAAVSELAKEFDLHATVPPGVRVRIADASVQMDAPEQLLVD